MIVPQSRDDFPAMLNAMGLVGVAVEVGTNRGHYAESFRAAWHGEILYCVDTWEEGFYAGEDRATREAARIECAQRLRATGKHTSMLPGSSVEVAQAFTRNPTHTQNVRGGFDFVYIDGDHSYEGVMADLEAWWPLVKPGGIIAGHDYIPDGWRHYGDGPGPARASVKEGLPADGWPCFVRMAVDHFFSGSELHPLNLTSPDTDGGWQSWWVRK